MHKNKKPEWFKGRWLKRGGTVKSYNDGKDYKLSPSQLSVFDEMGGLWMIIQMSREIDEGILISYNHCVEWWITNDSEMMKKIFTKNQLDLFSIKLNKTDNNTMEYFDENSTAKQIAFYIHAAKKFEYAAENYSKVLDMVYDGKIRTEKWDEIIRLIIKENPDYANQLELKRLYEHTNDKFYEKILYEPRTKTLKKEWFFVLVGLGFIALFVIVGNIIAFINSN